MCGDAAAFEAASAGVISPAEVAGEVTEFPLLSLAYSSSRRVDPRGGYGHARTRVNRCGGLIVRAGAHRSSARWRVFVDLSRPKTRAAGKTNSNLRTVVERQGW